MARSKSALLGIGGILTIVVAGLLIFNFPGASNQGYAPEQPIPYSHKLHAGDLKIDCKYCHVGATKSAHATVPSLNICMNCHKVVKTDSPHIQKLWKHYQEGTPIEWVRIHHLPEHAKFPHSRHVNRGVACQTCHGPIETMDKVYQAQPLTMGWCLECHRGQTTPKYIQDTKTEETREYFKNTDSPNAVAPYNCATCHY